MNTTYKVTDVRQVVRFTTAGREAIFYDVHITTAHGATGYIRVPVAEYNAESLKKKLGTFATQLELAFNLVGE